MDLFKTRCGCGTIYAPAVRTQRTCSACTERDHQRARAATPAAAHKEAKTKAPYQERPGTWPAFELAKRYAWANPIVEVWQAPSLGDQLKRIQKVFEEPYPTVHAVHPPIKEYTVAQLREGSRKLCPRQSTVTIELKHTEGANRFFQELAADAMARAVERSTLAGGALDDLGQVYGCERRAELKSSLYGGLAVHYEPDADFRERMRKALGGE